MFLPGAAFGDGTRRAEKGPGVGKKQSPLTTDFGWFLEEEYIVTGSQVRGVCKPPFRWCCFFSGFGVG